MGEAPVESGGVGKITHGIQPATILMQTLEFIRKELPVWRDDPDRDREESEDRLNSQLCKRLSVQANFHFPMIHFHHEEYQKGRRRVDIAACPTTTMHVGLRRFTIYQPLLVIEGKRLPAPSRTRKHEYVTGYAESTGGIQRFKLGLHGHAVDVAAMIGYVQNNSAHWWFDEINEWIRTLVADGSDGSCSWTLDDCLSKFSIDSGDIATSMSRHVRFEDTASSAIDLKHFWVST